MSKFFRTKVRIPRPYNPREVMALQSELFRQGCKWLTDPDQFRNEPEMMGIFISDKGTLTWTRSMLEFEASGMYELSWNITTTVQLVTPGKVSIDILGRTLDVDEVQEAIKNLKPVDY